MTRLSPALVRASVDLPFDVSSSKLPSIKWLLQKPMPSSNIIARIDKRMTIVTIARCVSAETFSYLSAACVKRHLDPAARAGVWVAACALTLASSAAKADIPEYQIVRLIAYNTSCSLNDLRTEPAPDGGVVVHVDCENETFYPEGVRLTCPDPDDGYSCNIETKAVEFDAVNTLKNQVNTTPPPP